MRYDTNVSVFQWEEEEENHSAKKNKQNRTITSYIDDAARRRLLRSISIHKHTFFDYFLRAAHKEEEDEWKMFSVHDEMWGWSVAVFE